MGGKSLCFPLNKSLLLYATLTLGCEITSSLEPIGCPSVWHWIDQLTHHPPHPYTTQGGSACRQGRTVFFFCFFFHLYWWGKVKGSQVLIELGACLRVVYHSPHFPHCGQHLSHLMHSNVPYQFCHSPADLRRVMVNNWSTSDKLAPWVKSSH